MRNRPEDGHYPNWSKRSAKLGSSAHFASTRSRCGAFSKEDT